ncbi:MAG TPA: YIP1 family protein [Candidatus Deferrimicrobium sp.]|nr:YIP1 family protein [Candidatus Deferrimicrobium sp.]
MEYFSSIKNCILKPEEFFSELSKSEPKPLKALMTLLLSSCILIVTIFLGQLIYGSDLIYTTFDYQTSSFIIEKFTTFQLFGYYIGSNQYLLLFLSKVFFFVKSWLILIGLIFVTAWGLKVNKEIKIEKVFEITAWGSTIFLILGGITGLFLVIRFLIPLYYHYMYYFIVVCILILYFNYVVIGMGKVSQISLYRRMLMVFTPVIIFLILWTTNHVDLILGHIF